RHPQHAVARQHYVLQRMRENGFITPQQQAAALTEQLVFAPRRPATYLAAPWYVEHVRRLLEERYGGTAPYQLGLQVYTAVDVGIQKAAEDAVRAGLRELDARQGFRGPLRHLDPKKIDALLAREAATKPLDAGRARGVVTELRPQALGIRTAWEKGWLPASALTWGTRRLAPSAFKPGDVIAVTVTEEAVGGEARFALDQEPQVEGALAAIDPYTGQVKAMVGGYDFRRSQFNRALQAKRQPGSAFKPLIYACAIDHGYTPASIVLDAPITLPDGNRPPWMPRNFEEKYYGPTPLRYALARSLNTVTVRLVDQMGLKEVLRSLPRFERVMSPATAYVMTSMLETVVQHGTGRRAAELGRPVAGKTGTTNDTHDAWFIGFTPDLLAGVWVGFDAERSLGKPETGGHAAAPIWTAFMKQAVAGRPVID